MKKNGKVVAILVAAILGAVCVSCCGESASVTAVTESTPIPEVASEAATPEAEPEAVPEAEPEKRPAFTVFYYNKSTDVEVTADHATPMEKSDIIAMMPTILEGFRDYYGITDRKGTTLQFLVDDDGLVWMEIPFPDLSGSYGKHISKDDVPVVFGSLPELFSKDMLPGMEFAEW